MHNTELRYELSRYVVKKISEGLAYLPFVERVEVLLDLKQWIDDYLDSPVTKEDNDESRCRKA